MVGLRLLDSLLEFGQQLDGALDLALHARAVRRRRSQMLQRPSRDGGDLVQFLVERVGLLLRFAE
jgi:hypothetical protein